MQLTYYLLTIYNNQAFVSNILVHGMRKFDIWHVAPRVPGGGCRAHSLLLQLNLNVANAGSSYKLSRLKLAQLAQRAFMVNCRARRETGYDSNTLLVGLGPLRTAYSLHRCLVHVYWTLHYRCVDQSNLAR